VIADSDRLEVLYRTPDEMGAAMIAGVLEEHGIRSTTTGGYTSGFRAEAPGELGILVASADLSHARTLLARVLRERHPIDWSVVDFKDPTPVHSEELEGPPGVEDNPAIRPALQFSLRTLVVIQTALCVVFALWHMLGGGETAAVLFVLLLFSLAISGTIYIARNFGRVSEYW
jgi:hypothetical protein